MLSLWQKIRNGLIPVFFVLLPLLVAIFILAQPLLFKGLHGALRPEAHAPDVQLLLDWMDGQDDFTETNRQLMAGKFNVIEQAHYRDVRRWLNRLPLIVMSSLLLLGALIALPPRPDLHRCARHALLLWKGLISLLILWGIIHWPSLFATLHYPFFGSESWKLPAGCYSLFLFPEWFWGVLGSLTLIATTLCLRLLQGATRPHTQQSP